VTQIDFYLDFVSPYTYLAFERLGEALDGIRCRIRYRPVLFAGLLKHHGQLGPAEIPGKREWTYRQVLWLANAAGVPMQLPTAHPFNPLHLLRLAIACDPQGEPSREVCENVFRHVWRSGADATDPARLAMLAAELAPARDPSSDEVKLQLRAHTDAAISRGVFGVPTFDADGRLFWGFDALAMLRAQLLGDPALDAIWEAGARVGEGVRR